MPIHCHWRILCLALISLSFANHCLGQSPNSPQSTAKLVESVSKQLQDYQAQSEPDPRPLRVVYFHPSDVEPLKDCRQRLTRILLDVQSFYRDEMKRVGFGARSFDLEVIDGKLRMHFVRGQGKASDYTYESGGEVQREIATALKDQFDPSHEHVLCINGMCTSRDDGSYFFYSPYYGSGSARNGLCHAADCELMDTLHYKNTAEKIRYTEHNGTRTQSLADYSCLYIGGIAHELGHAFGLLHKRQKPWEKQRLGTALMGSGNYTYRHELRGKKGSFLTLDTAMQLASHPLFSGSRHGLDVPVKSKLEDLQFEQDGKSLIVRGKLSANIPAYSAIVFTNPDIAKGWHKHDYDSLTWVSGINDDRFEVKTRIHQPGRNGLKLRFCHLNGMKSNFKFEYEVDQNGSPQADSLNNDWRVQQAEQAYLDGNRKQAKLLATKNLPLVSDAPSKAKLKHLVELVDGITLIAPIDVNEDTAALSRLQWASAKVGWGRPARDQYYIDRNVKDAVFLESADEFFPRGLYAHAPSRYVFELNGKWKTFAATAALQKGTSIGSGIFRVMGDGKLLHETKLLSGTNTEKIRVNVESVQKIELAIDSGKPGNAQCWTIWGNPTLSR